MPSVILALANTAKALPAFEERGAGDRMPGATHDVPVYIEATKPINTVPRNWFLPIFHAISTASTVLLSQATFKNIFKPIVALGRAYEIPVATFRFSGKDDAVKAELKSMGLQTDLTNDNIFVGTPGAHHLARIFALSPEDDRIRPGHVSADAWVAWVYLMKGVQIITTTLNEMSKNPNSSIATAVTDTSVNIAPGAKGKVCLVDGSVGGEFTNPFVRNLIPNPSDYMFASNNTSAQSFPGHFVDVKSIPTTIQDGIFFPFFSGMLTADKTTAHHVFESIFYRSLSDTAEGSTRMLTQIRSGIKQLAFHRSGIILSHIYKGIQMALEIPHSRLTIVLDGALYCGFVLQGEYVLRLYGKVVVPGECAGDLRAINKFKDSAEQIAAKINTVLLPNGSIKYNVSASSFESSRSALETFISLDKADFVSTTYIQEIIDLLKGMKFADQYPVPTVENMKDCVNSILTGSNGPIEKYPAYLGSGVLVHPTRTMVALCMYGPKAPSPNYGDKGGLTFTFPGEDKEDLNVKKVDGVRPLQYLAFQMQPINLAHAQWMKVFTEGHFTIPKGRKGRKEFTDAHKADLVVASPVFEEVYEKIKTIVNSQRGADKLGKRKGDGSTAANKRKRSDEKSKMSMDM